MKTIQPVVLAILLSQVQSIHLDSFNKQKEAQTIGLTSISSNNVNQLTQQKANLKSKSGHKDLFDNEDELISSYKDATQKSESMAQKTQTSDYSITNLIKKQDSNDEEEIPTVSDLAAMIGQTKKEEAKQKAAEKEKENKEKEIQLAKEKKEKEINEAKEKKEKEIQNAKEKQEQEKELAIKKIEDKKKEEANEKIKEKNVMEFSKKVKQESQVAMDFLQEEANEHKNKSIKSVDNEATQITTSSSGGAAMKPESSAKAEKLRKEKAAEQVKQNNEKKESSQQTDEVKHQQLEYGKKKKEEILRKQKQEDKQESVGSTLPNQGELKKNEADQKTPSPDANKQPQNKEVTIDQKKTQVQNTVQAKQTQGYHLAQYSQGLQNVWKKLNMPLKEENLIQLEVDDAVKKDYKKRNESFTAMAGSWMADNLSVLLGTKK